MAVKGFKLIKAAVAGMEALEPSPIETVHWQGPVMILGGGVATYAAAQELIRREIECVIAVATDNWEDEVRMLHEHYPGERHYYGRLEAILREVDESPLVRRITVGNLKSPHRPHRRFPGHLHRPDGRSAPGVSGQLYHRLSGRPDAKPGQRLRP